MSDLFYSSYVGTLFKKISHVPEFEKDLKRLKRFSSLKEDLRMFIKVALNAFHKQNIDSKAIFHISDLGIRSPKICKAKKFACKGVPHRRGDEPVLQAAQAFIEEKVDDE